MTLALPVAGLVLLAALMHASWNALLKSAGDGVLAYAVFCGAVGVVGSLMLLIVPFPAPASWPYVVVSTVIHLGYFAGLTAAYRVGDLSQIYPLARGASPLFVTLGAFLFAAEVPSGREAAGILIASLGIASLAFAGTRPIRADPRPVLYALATALTIGAYTVVDGIGVRRSDSAAGYAALYFVLIAISVVGATTVLRGPGPLLAFARRYRLRGGVGGILLAGSYRLRPVGPQLQRHGADRSAQGDQRHLRRPDGDLPPR